MNILFQNEHFCVIDKPANTLSVPGRMGDKDNRPVVGLLLQKQLGMQVFPVHRLDFEVSGVLMFALSSRAHQVANNWFERKQVQKIYRAITEITEGPLPEVGQKFTWKGKVLRGKKRAYMSPAGKHSETLAEVTSVEKNLISWHLEPVTGRSHQLRFDLSRHGFPILGDTLYGSQKTHGRDGIALRAITLIVPDQAKEFGLPNKIKAEQTF